MNKWIPISSGKLPVENCSVHITYLSFLENIPTCNVLAYRIADKWFWTDDDTLLKVPVIAWKEPDLPYAPDESRIEIVMDKINVNREDAIKIVEHLKKLDLLKWVDDANYIDELIEVHIEDDFHSMIDWLYEDAAPHVMFEVPKDIEDFPCMLQLSNSVIYWYMYYPSTHTPVPTHLKDILEDY